MSLLQNEYLIKGLSWLNYSAINLGYKEWSTKATFLKKLEIDCKIDFLCANVFLKDSDKTVFKPYLIKELKSEIKDKKLPFKKLNIALVGLTDNLMSQLFVNKPGEPVLEYKDPIEVAKSIMPKIRGKADLIVLLYYGKFQKMQLLLKEVPGFDAAVIGGETYLANPQNNPEASVIAVTSPSMGKYVGILTLVMDKNKKILSSSTKQVPLDEKIKDDPKFLQLATDYEQATQQPLQHK